MSTAEWARVKDLFEAALRLPEGERPAFLSLQPDPPAILGEVRSLLTTYETSPEFLEGDAPMLPPALSPEWPAPLLEGRRLGAWQLLHEIGHGGMGTVWEAQRADEQYHQRAAVKLLRASFLSEQAIARFRDERQILASLSHPHIARLLDGGTLEDGSPYLVMEYIEGPALDAWCDARQLNLRARLQLFLSVCAAVEYAHRHLVIHRDLKPANILVTPDGVAKLLDFGIAKLIGADAASAQPETRLLTPEFASPEQLRGGAVTTSSDIFSLGVLLYLLVTGQRPFTKLEGDMLGLIRAVCEEEPPSPRAAARERGREFDDELDAIVLQGLRKDPEERYQSVRALADDIRAWMDGREVSAAPQPWWRRSAKWIRRHKAQSTAVALAAASLLAGTGVSLWQANVAERQSQRAERRFRNVRTFSRSLLFELHQAIRDLPGATPARNLLLQRATEFLDDLAGDPNADAPLKLELAGGYNSLGRVQGDAFSENVGNRDAAIESFRKAARLGEAAWAAAASVDAGLVLLDAYDNLMRMHLEKHNPPEAELWHNRYRDFAITLEAAYPRDLRVGAAVADAYSARALYWVQRNEIPKAKEFYRQALERYAELQKKGMDGKEFRTDYAFASKRLGALLIFENSLDEAESRYRTALAMEDALAAAMPGETNLRLNRSFTQSDLALILKRKKDYQGAASLYEEVLRTRQAALEKDPNNLRNMHLTGAADEKLGGVYSLLPRHREAIVCIREAMRLRDRAAALTKDYAERRDAAESRVLLAQAILVAAGDPAFHAADGERLSDARAALHEAAAAVPHPGPGQSPSPDDRGLSADFQSVSERLARLK